MSDIPTMFGDPSKQTAKVIAPFVKTTQSDADRVKARLRKEAAKADEFALKGKQEQNRLKQEYAIDSKIRNRKQSMANYRRNPKHTGIDRL